VAWVERPNRPAHQARRAGTSPVCQVPARPARDEGAARRAQPRDAPQECRLTAFESYASMTCSPPTCCRDTRTTRADAVRWEDWITAVPLS
jgi:hypothetical protein